MTQARAIHRQLPEIHDVVTTINKISTSPVDKVHSHCRGEVVEYDLESDRDGVWNNDQADNIIDVVLEEVDYIESPQIEARMWRSRYDLSKIGNRIRIQLPYHDIDLSCELHTQLPDGWQIINLDQPYPKIAIQNADFELIGVSHDEIETVVGLWDGDGNHIRDCRVDDRHAAERIVGVWLHRYHTVGDIHSC